MLRTLRCTSLFLLSLLINLHSAYSTTINGIGVPFVENYSKTVYQAGNQNWSVAKSKSGVMFYGNSEGLLSYDGRYWQLYKMPNNVIVRSVATDGNKVYAGAFGEFGYWDYNVHGKFSYTSLISLIPKSHPLNGEVWKIYVDASRVIFQTFDCIYIYSKGKISVVDVKEPYLFLLKAGSRYFAQKQANGLYELKGNVLELIKGTESIGHSGVLSVLPFKNQILIGTAKNGLFVYDGTEVKPWITQADNFLKTYQLNNGVVLFDKYVAYGTILNGIVIIDERGNVIQRINKSSGLQNNTVLSLFTDEAQNLWAGLDNGIDRIELNSSLYFYFDKAGQFGTVYSSIIHQNKIYIGTNQGLFYSNWPVQANVFHAFDFKFIPNSQGQVWDLALIDGNLFSGSNEGTFLVNNGAIRRISSVNGGWVIKKLNANPNVLIQGNYTGLAFYRKDANGNWQFSNQLKGFGEPSRFIEQDARGQLWVSHAYKGIYKVTLSADLQTATSVTYYDGKKGLPGSYNINVFNLEGKILFSSDKGFFIYDDISDKFKPYTELNELLGSFASSNRVIPAEGKRYWLVNHGKVALANFATPGKVLIDSVRFNMLSGHMVQYYENINRINASLYLISVDDGFVLYNESNDNGKASNLPSVLIRKIENATGKSTVIAETDKHSSTITLPNNQNNIRISYALPYYQKGNVQYQYFLEGYSGEWSEWSGQSQKEFTNLPHGTYHFRVRAQVMGSFLTPITELTFEISPPWYASMWAWLVYLLLFIIAVIRFRKLYYKKLAKHQLEIEEQLLKEQEEFRKQEALANERKIAQLQKEQLEADLAGKKREMANTTMNIVYKNELLEKIRDEIHNLTDATGNLLSYDQLKKIQKVIDEGMNDERDWNVFENSFNEAQGNFFKKLKGAHPDLVPNDLKLCAYLRMNMSSKEMASLLNITVRGVEIRRYRLRKKLNLPHDKNLAEYLMEQ
ncbi:transcriptional regulator [Solitalea sp. MAHUQ-68]|uniref:Transcriptional regulator n=1 Tax=Solitalea agri TaxID=2953739 RepID=A0A9X2F8F1_9SPHI|nr:triple tyrosine motif-containing protein [Solitalea agri]MCO4294241.1 transcriptional regulator [Solitalea agri]